MKKKLITGNITPPPTLTLDMLEEAFSAMPQQETPGPILVRREQYDDPDFRAAARKYLGATFPGDEL